MATRLDLSKSSGASVRAPFTFGRIVCAVDGSRSAREAVHQATKLAGPLDTLTFVAVSDARGVGPMAQATLGERHAEEAVEAARAAAQADGVEATSVIVHASDVGRALLDAAGDSGLLVVGSHGQSRTAGILLGSTTTRALHESAVPVLVARSRPELAFPGAILVGIQGVEDHHAAVVAATIAARHHSHVVLAHAGHSGPAVRHALAEQATDVLEITGRDPVIVSVDAAPAERLPGMAISIGAGLLVLGSHGRRGPRALTSVSERVAHRASCSVLVLRPN